MVIVRYIIVQARLNNSTFPQKFRSPLEQESGEDPSHADPPSGELQLPTAPCTWSFAVRGMHVGQGEELLALCRQGDGDSRLAEVRELLESLSQDQRREAVGCRDEVADLRAAGCLTRALGWQNSSSLGGFAEQPRDSPGTDQARGRCQRQTPSMCCTLYSAPPVPQNSIGAAGQACA